MFEVVFQFNFIDFLIAKSVGSRSLTFVCWGGVIQIDKFLIYRYILSFYPENTWNPGNPGNPRNPGNPGNPENPENP